MAMSASGNNRLFADEGNVSIPKADHATFGQAISANCCCGDCGSGEIILQQLFTQCAPINSKTRGGAALIAGTMFHDDPKQCLFHLTYHQIVQIRRLLTV
jgi:hypothetical protein